MRLNIQGDPGMKPSHTTLPRPRRPEEPGPLRRLVHGTGVALLLTLMMSPMLAAAWFVMLEPLVDDVRTSLNPPSSPHRLPEPVDVVDRDAPAPDFGYDEDEWQSWSCGYAPTMNNDWHDDVLCTDGVSEHRPYLRPRDSFITGAELQRAAARYEAQLNFGS